MYHRIVFIISMIFLPLTSWAQAPMPLLRAKEALKIEPPKATDLARGALKKLAECPVAVTPSQIRPECTGRQIKFEPVNPLTVRTVGAVRGLVAGDARVIALGGALRAQGAACSASGCSGMYPARSGVSALTRGGSTSAAAAVQCVGCGSAGVATVTLSPRNIATSSSAVRADGVSMGGLSLKLTPQPQNATPQLTVGTARTTEAFRSRGAAIDATNNMNTRLGNSALKELRHNAEHGNLWGNVPNPPYIGGVK